MRTSCNYAWLEFQLILCDFVYSFQSVRLGARVGSRFCELLLSRSMSLREYCHLSTKHLKKHKINSDSSTSKELKLYKNGCRLIWKKAPKSCVSSWGERTHRAAGDFLYRRGPDHWDQQGQRNRNVQFLGLPQKRITLLALCRNDRA